MSVKRILVLQLRSEEDKLEVLNKIRTMNDDELLNYLHDTETNIDELKEAIKAF